jgi:hypothetical protein
LISFLFFYSSEFLSRILKRSNYGSLPNIHEKFLSEELDFDFNNIKKSKNKTTDIIRERYFIDEEKKVNTQYLLKENLIFLLFRKEIFNQLKQFQIELI